MSILVGNGHDNKSVNVNSYSQNLEVSLTDGRKFSTDLFDKIEEEATNVTFKGPKCIIRLLKNDPNVTWDSLSVSR